MSNINSEYKYTKNINFSIVSYEIYYSDEDIETIQKLDNYLHSSNFNSKEHKFDIFLCDENKISQIINNVKNTYKEKSIKIYESSSNVKEFVKRIQFKNQLLIDGENFYLLKENNKIYLEIKQRTNNDERYILRIIREINLRYNEETSKILFHGAFLEHNSKGILISGNKGSGKTTLLCHFLSTGNANYLTNDKLFLDTKGSVEYIPLSARIGVGTAKNNNRIREFIMKGDFLRSQNSSLSNIDFINELNEVNPEIKFDLVSSEVKSLFSCNLISNSKLDIILLPKITKEHSINLRTLNEKEKFNELLENLLTPYDDMWKSPWLIDIELNENKLLTEAIKKLIKLFENTRCIAFEYGYNVTSKDVVETIQKYINEEVN